MKRKLMVLFLTFFNIILYAQNMSFLDASVIKRNKIKLCKEITLGEGIKEEDKNNCLIAYYDINGLMTAYTFHSIYSRGYGKFEDGGIVKKQFSYDINKRLIREDMLSSVYPYLDSVFLDTLKEYYYDSLGRILKEEFNKKIYPSMVVDYEYKNDLLIKKIKSYHRIIKDNNKCIFDSIYSKDSTVYYFDQNNRLIKETNLINDKEIDSIVTIYDSTQNKSSEIIYSYFKEAEIMTPFKEFKTDKYNTAKYIDSIKGYSNDDYLYIFRVRYCHIDSTVTLYDTKLNKVSFTKYESEGKIESEGFTINDSLGRRIQIYFKNNNINDNRYYFYKDNGLLDYMNSIYPKSNKSDVTEFKYEFYE